MTVVHAAECLTGLYCDLGSRDRANSEPEWVLRGTGPSNIFDLFGLKKGARRLCGCSLVWSEPTGVCLMSATWAARTIGVSMAVALGFPSSR